MSEVKRYALWTRFGEPEIREDKDGQIVLAADHDRIVAGLTEAGRKMQAERDQLAERCRELEAERDEADRRAGAAERKLAEEVDSRRRRDTWLHKAKEEAGYAQKESFDNVWAETLGKANERDTLRAEVERLRKDAELGREMQRAASELPDGWEIRVCVERGAGWVELTNQDGEGIADTWSGQESLSCEISDAIDAALEASR